MIDHPAEDFLTVLAIAEGEPGALTKVWDGDTISPAADATWFRQIKKPVRGLGDIHGELQLLQTAYRACIVRGDLVPGRDPHRFRRTLRRQKDGAEPDMQDAQHHWFCLDCDKVIAPFGVELGEVETIGKYLRSLLPAPLNAAQCVVQLSASAGHPCRAGKVSGHLWFWSAEKRTSAEFKTWVESLDPPKFVDRSTLNPVQIHFTANPITKGPDPIAARTVMLDGTETVTVPKGDVKHDMKDAERPQRCDRTFSDAVKKAGWLFKELVETSGVLRSKGPHIGRNARLASLDILINEFGYSTDGTELRAAFDSMCVGPGDNDAEADFDEAMQWAESPADNRILAGSILTSIRVWANGRGDHETLAKVDSVYDALRSMNVAERHEQNRKEMLADPRVQDAIRHSGGMARPPRGPENTQGISAMGAVNISPFPATQAAADRMELVLKRWMNREIPLRDYLLGEILCTTSRILVVGETGVGKTLFLMELAASVAAGKSLLGWAGRRPASVMYLDGEMSAETMKERLLIIGARYDQDIKLYVYNRDVLAADDMPPLNTSDGMAWLLREIEAIKPDLIIFDNIMSLNGGNMSEEQSWEPIKHLNQNISRRRVAVIWAHHTGHDPTKSYGTKTREWEMDAVIMLHKTDAEDLGGKAGAEFIIEFTKSRHQTPKSRREFEPRVVSATEDGFQVREDATVIIKRKKPKEELSLTDIVRDQWPRAYDRLAASDDVKVESDAFGVMTRKVPADSIRDELRRHGRLPLKQGGALTDSASRTIIRVRTELMKTGQWAEEGDLIWRVGPAEEHPPAKICLDTDRMSP